MYGYNHRKVKETAEKILGRRLDAVPVGNHQLERHLVYRLEDKEGTSFIFKLYFRKNRWNREVASLKLLSGSNVKSPGLIDYGVLKDGTEWLITEFVEGEPFFRVQDVIGREGRLSIYEDMGREIGKIHSFREFDFFGNWDEEGNSIQAQTDYPYVFIRRAEITISNLLEQHLPEHALHRKAAEVLRGKYDLIRDVTTARLCHNDYDERNVLVREASGRWEVTAVLDFEQSLPWDKDRDIADLYHALTVRGDEYRDAFLKGYECYSSLEEGFYRKLDFYLIYSGINICSWAYEPAPDYYRQGLKLLEEFV